MTTIPWRPIAELPEGLDEALVFDPASAWLSGQPGDERRTVIDDRVHRARRSADGTWWVDAYQGGFDVNPTHFAPLTVPDGFPAALDPAPFLAAEAAEAERICAERAAEADRLAAQGGKSDLELKYEAYWRDVVAREHGHTP